MRKINKNVFIPSVAGGAGTHTRQASNGTDTGIGPGTPKPAPQPRSLLAHTTSSCELLAPRIRDAAVAVAAPRIRPAALLRGEHPAAPVFGPELGKNAAGATTTSIATSGTIGRLLFVAWSTSIGSLRSPSSIFSKRLPSWLVSVNSCPVWNALCIHVWLGEVSEYVCMWKEMTGGVLFYFILFKFFFIL